MMVAEQLDAEFEIARFKNINDPNPNIQEKNIHLQEINELMSALVKLFSHNPKTNYHGRTIVVIDEGTQDHQYY